MPSLPDALQILSASTGITWTRTSFFQAIIDNVLPLRATTPNNLLVVDNMGKADFDAGFQELEFRRLALLDSYTIKDLALNGDAYTRAVALDPGDPGFLTWPEIKASRSRSREHFMGESTFMFSQFVHVTDDTCRVPPETIAELEALMPGRAPSSVKVGTTNTTYLMKRNSLDGPIEQAIKRAGSTSSGIVWIHLRDLALEGVSPFTGRVEKDVLEYTNDKNQLKTLSKDAVKKRLLKYRRSSRTE